ncbi:TetR/AcrR family transcriptional regulator [Cytobacillus oceanisediminis]|uniref:TetR family transcriptional regulator n=1 Tax=Cytobacillus oceanisediminis TaxID=665099 RepID=A0A562JPG3_9BACI|nr:TetR/AcrR family transcriptional regulator [Cytobacillus oceanisediminis]TWH85066.1 TetR family transcriptional regulator [Cytobacillus oceanisediminis]
MSIDRKQQILEAATKSFSLFGYKATTMDQVAKLANVGKGTIYTFFKNKEELFDEIIHSLIAEMKAAADEAIDPTLSFHENVHRGLYKILEFRLKHQLTIKLFQEEKEMGTPAVMEVMDQMEDAILNYLKEKVNQAIEKGEIRECDPELTAFVMLKLYIALIFDWEKRHEPLEKEKIAMLFEQYIMKGLSN